MLDTSIQVKTDNFDGPLGLLLHLVQREEMDVRKLDLTKITQQYLGYLAKMRELNFDLAGEYLFMASTLLLIKSKSCVTEEESKDGGINGGSETVISEAELIRRLEDLQKFQKLGEKLWNLPKKGHEIFVKPRVDRKSIIDSILTPMDMDKLTISMVELIQKNKRKYTVVTRDRLSIKEKLNFLKSYLQKGVQSNFDEILIKDDSVEEQDRDVTNVIITFISLLELARLNKIRIFQNEDSEKIYIDVTSDFKDFDIELADGFEDENEEKSENENLISDAMNENIN
ncbi:MAG: segregation/condensation protein A [Bacteriovoracaceae bacterium]|nr:segregation/condensation protein A [Bacteriovoracaceae bacterium]